MPFEGKVKCSETLARLRSSPLSSERQGKTTRTRRRRKQKKLAAAGQTSAKRISNISRSVQCEWKRARRLRPLKGEACRFRPLGSSPLPNECPAECARETCPKELHARHVGLSLVPILTPARSPGFYSSAEGNEHE